MSDVRERLHVWTDAGLVSDDQAAAILAYEARQDGGTATAPSMRRGVLAEAIGYVGAALALGAVVALIGQLWQDLTTPGRLVLVGLLVVVLGGAAISLRRAGTPALRRLTSVLFAASSLSVGWFAGLVAAEVVDADPEMVGLTVGLALLVGGVPVLLGRPTVPAQLVVLGGAITTAVAALLFVPLVPDPLWFGLLVWGIGLAWFLLGRGHFVAPLVPAEILGGGLALLATQISSAGAHRTTALVLGVVTAAALVVLALGLDALHALVLGALGLFVIVPQLVFDLFGDAIGAPLTLLVIGLLLVVLAVGLGRAGRQVRRDVNRGDVDRGDVDRQDPAAVGGGDVR